MKNFLMLWKRLPLILRAPIIGFLVFIIGSVLALLPLIGNTKFLPDIPWSLPFTVLLLWGYWYYFSGKGRPSSTAQRRMFLARRNEVSFALQRFAVLAGFVGFISIIILRLLLPSLLPMNPPQIDLDLSPYPLLTVWGMLLSVSMIAGMTEEVGFRGYMQKPLEEKYGLTVAILIVGTIFWLSHLSHATLNITHLPFHLWVSIILGVYVYLANSLWPAIFMHTLADMVLLPTYFFQTPDIFWQALNARPIWKVGPTLMFYIMLLLFLFSAALTAFLFISLYKHRTTHTTP